MYCQGTEGGEVRRLADQIYRERRGYLLSIARRNAACEADAEEALQEAFAAFIARFDPGGGAPPLAWLTLTMKRECWAGRGRREVSVAAASERDAQEFGSVLQPMPATTTSVDERVAEGDIARHELARLKPDERNALILQAAGFGYREIGERRGWTYTKVNRCLTEGRAALRSLGR